MKVLFDLVNYLWPKPRYRRPPRQIINEFYSWQDYGDDEALLMLTNHARSPQNARQLLEDHNARHAYEVIRRLPRKRSKWTARRRLRRLLRKMMGHTEGDPYRCNHVERERL